jgi:hypothetical protein
VDPAIYEKGGRGFWLYPYSLKRVGVGFQQLIGFWFSKGKGFHSFLKTKNLTQEEEVPTLLALDTKRGLEEGRGFPTSF